jgi:hypothetical protein
MDIPPTAHQPVKTKRRRRWPWITGAVVAVLVLVGIVNNKPQTNGTPTVGTVATASSTSSASTTTVDVPITTTVAAVVAPPPVVTTVPQVVVAPRTTYQAAPKPPPVVAPPVAPPAPVTGKYHAGEFCSHVGATAISTTGAPMTCLQEGKYKRWHNN